MRSSRFGIRSSVVAVMAAALLIASGGGPPAGAAPNDPVVGTIPANVRPWGPVAAPDGHIWYVSYSGQEPGDPSDAVDQAPDGTTTTYPIPSVAALGLVVAPDGAVWYVGGDSVGRFDRASGTFTHWAQNYSIAVGTVFAGDGNLWLVGDGNGQLARVSPDGTFLFPGTARTMGALANGPDDTLWFTSWFPDRVVGRLDPATGQELAAFPLPEQDWGVHDITAGPDGNMWFTENREQQSVWEPPIGGVGRVTPSGVFTEFRSGVRVGSHPSGIVAGPDGNLWFTEQWANGVARITTVGVVTELAGPAGFDHPVNITADSWRVIFDGGEARAQLGVVELLPDPNPGTAASTTTSSLPPTCVCPVMPAVPVPGDPSYAG